MGCLGNVAAKHHAPATVGDFTQDFAKLPPSELQDSILARQDKIFILLEEIRRLRIQQRIRVSFPCKHHASICAVASLKLGGHCILQGGEVAIAESTEKEEYTSALPFLPPVNENTLNTYYAMYATIGG